ncbi:hypothetical protein ACFWJ4_28010 [Kitasatospora sp. NPDC127067]|uniref:hypothetical protein n=1 Tax=Kitasatospora sp. NPDC127067 TaxID=3347126 RepID=UPI0036685023
MHHTRNPDTRLQLHELALDFTSPEEGDPRGSIVAEVTPGKAYRPPVDGRALPPFINPSYLEQS